jgi:hypothetical protein
MISEVPFVMRCAVSFTGRPAVGAICVIALLFSVCLDSAGLSRHHDESPAPRVECEADGVHLAPHGDAPDLSCHLHACPLCSDPFSAWHQVERPEPLEVPRSLLESERGRVELSPSSLGWFSSRAPPGHAA